MDRMLLCVVSLIILVALYAAYRKFRTTKEQFATSEERKTILESINDVLSNIKQRSSSMVSNVINTDDDEDAINNSA